MKKQRISITPWPNELVRKVDLIAKEENRSRSNLLEHIANEYVKKWEKNNAESKGDTTT